MKHDDLYIREVWKDIPMETMYKYQASTLGRIRKVENNGKYTIVKPYHDVNAYNISVRLRLKNNKQIKKCVHTLVGETFLGVKAGYKFYLKNGIKSDSRVENIGYASTKEIIARNNKRKSKTVFKIDYRGNVVDVYRTTRECANANNFSQSAIVDRCNGKIKSIFASDGFAYCYEDDNKQLKKIMKAIGV